MKIAFGPDIYDAAMQALGPECDVVKFDVVSAKQFYNLMTMLAENGFDAIIKFGDVCDVGSEVD